MAKKKSVKRAAKKVVHQKFQTTRRMDILLLILVLSVLILAAVTMTKNSVNTVTVPNKVKVVASPTAKPVVKTVKPATVKVTK